MIGHPEEFDVLAHVRMVADDHRDVGVEVAARPAPEEFDQGVVVLRDEEDHLLGLGAVRPPPVHLVARSDGVGKGALQ